MPYDLLEKYATDEVISEAKAETANFEKSAVVTTVLYSEFLRKKALYCSCICNKSELSAIVSEGPRLSIHYSMRTHWGVQKDATIHSRACHATSLIKVQQDLQTLTSSTSEETRERRK